MKKVAEIILPNAMAQYFRAIAFEEAGRKMAGAMPAIVQATGNQIVPSLNGTTILAHRSMRPMLAKVNGKRVVIVGDMYIRSEFEKCLRKIPRL